MISVFYDDKCGLCSREINFYKKISQKNDFKWLGISTSSEDLNSSNVKQVDSLMYLHVKDCEGNFYIGVDAFVLIWSKLPYFKYLNYIILLPGIYQFANYIYKKFAKYRFKRLKHCQIEFQKIK